MVGGICHPAFCIIWNCVPQKKIYIFAVEIVSGLKNLSDLWRILIIQKLVPKAFGTSDQCTTFLQLKNISGRTGHSKTFGLPASNRLTNFRAAHGKKAQVITKPPKMLPPSSFSVSCPKEPTSLNTSCGLTIRVLLAAELPVCNVCTHRNL